MAKKKATKLKSKSKRISGTSGDNGRTSQGISKPLVYGPRVNPGTSLKKTEPKKP